MSLRTLSLRNSHILSCRDVKTDFCSCTWFPTLHCVVSFSPEKSLDNQRPLCYITIRRLQKCNCGLVDRPRSYLIGRETPRQFFYFNNGIFTVKTIVCVLIVLIPVHPSALLRRYYDTLCPDKAAEAPLLRKNPP